MKELSSSAARTVRKHGQIVNANFYREQLNLVYKSLIEKCLAIVNGKGVILQGDNVKRHCARELWRKLMNWDFIHHIRPILQYRISVYSYRYSTFYVVKNLKIYAVAKIAFPDILLITD